jgi:sterol desaturase/sphingolipid hydroxylase (fatty acid hydroxylase superfamily)
VKLQEDERIPSGYRQGTTSDPTIAGNASMQADGGTAASAPRLGWLVLAALCGVVATFLAVYSHSAWEAVRLKVLNYSGKRLEYLLSQKFLIQSAPVLAALMMDLFYWGWGDSAVSKLLRPSKSTQTDLMCWVLAVLKLDFILKFVVTFGVFFLALRFSANYKLDIELPGSSLPPALQFIFWLAITDFVSYWRHRLEHSVRFLWVFHEFHHSAAEFNTLLGAREHAVESLLIHVIAKTPFLVIGMLLPQILVLALALKLLQTLHHTNLPWTWGWIGKHLIYPPLGHRLHHSADETHFNRNFGDVFVFWDKLFGTWDGDYMRRDFMATTVIGLPNSGYNQRGVISDYVLPFVKLWRRS